MNRNLKKSLRLGKCRNCQKGDFSKCSPKHKTVFLEQNGIKKHFCNLGCIMLFLDSDESNRKIFEGFVVGGLFQ